MNQLDILAPTSGHIKSLSTLKDPVFNQYMMGIGIAIQGQDEKIYSPIQGKVTMIADTKHAIIISNHMMDVMIHVGIDTCKMKGLPFQINVSLNDNVNTNDCIMRVNHKMICEAGFEDDVIIIILKENNMEYLNNIPKDCIRGTKIF